MGGNINGASVIKVPGWVKSPLGRYYMYFADHKGTYIRLACADEITGPWQVHTPGVLDVKDSLFEPKDISEPPQSDKPDWAGNFNESFLYAHVASPDVHVDHSSHTIKMYYHGLLANSDQQTRLAVSADGLNFSPRAPLLGPAYFRVFEYRNQRYAISWAGKLHRAKTGSGRFEDGPDVLEKAVSNYPGRTIRHSAVYLHGDTLEVFFSCIGDKPERILHVTVTLGDNWRNWSAGPVHDVLWPELEWEGALLPLATSKVGACDSPLNELRDPCVFVENKKVYLFYCGAGEAGGIGLAALEHDQVNL